MNICHSSNDRACLCWGSKGSAALSGAGAQQEQLGGRRDCASMHMARDFAELLFRLAKATMLRQSDIQKMDGAKICEKNESCSRF